MLLHPSARICGAALLLILSSAAIAQAGPAPSHLRIKANGDRAVCQALVINETDVMQADQNYSRDTISNSSNADIELGSEVVGRRNVEGDLEQTSHLIQWTSNAWHNANVRVAQYDFLNNGKAQTVYHLSDESHYFAGDIFIVTDASVPEATVAAAIEKLDQSDRGFDDTHRFAAQLGWHAFSGAEMFYGRARYTYIAPFRFQDKTYLVATGGRPGPAWITYEPQPSGRLKERCYFFQTK
jgi:hypothetical protein